MEPGTLSERLTKEREGATHTHPPHPAPVATSDRIVVVEVGRDGRIRDRDGEDTQNGIRTSTGVYLPGPDDWGTREKRSKMTGKARVHPSILVREGIPSPINLGRAEERRWPDAKALDHYKRSEVAFQLSRSARGAKKGMDLGFLSGIPRWAWIGLAIVAAIIGYALLDPSYLPNVLGHGTGKGG